MSSLLSYKNYNGTVEYSREDNCLFGKVVGIKSLLSYEGDSVYAMEHGKTLNAVVEEAIGKMVCQG